MNSPKPKILYVDDEVNNLTGFKASFRREYQIFTAISAKEALDILEQHNDFKIIISDQRMPEVTGVEFLKTVFDKYPLPVRMLLTGYADIEDVIKAINEGHVYRYITKPWDENDMKVTIDNALEFYDTKNELRQRNLELEKAYNELEKFVYSASHDMRAPLASISGLVKLLKMGDIDPENIGYLGKIEDSIEKLDVFIQNIINYYRSSQVEEHYVEIDFEQVIEDNFEIFRYYENASEITFSKQINQNTPYIGDLTRIKIILNNLITNAIKYQREEEPNKKIEIIVNVDEKSANIEIKDNGIGIEEENIEEVFSMFYRSTVKKSGSGIGLYIVRETIKKLNGTIKVESKLGEGTNFIINIPNHKEKLNTAP